MTTAVALARHVGKAFLSALGVLKLRETPATAAAISYFSLFALFPGIVALLAIVDALLGWMDLHRTVLELIVGLFPGTRRDLTATLGTIRPPSIALIISCMVMTLWSSTWVLTFVENALNVAWGVPKRRTFWQSRVRSLTLMGSCGVLLLASAVMTVLVSTLQSLAERFPEPARTHVIEGLSSTVLVGGGFFLAIVVFFLVYKLMPDRKVLWTEALSGALLSATLWEIASYIFGKLVPHFDYQRVYGTMGVLIAVISWVYTSALILLVGGHFSARLHGPDLEQAKLFSSRSIDRSGRSSNHKIRVVSRHRR